MKIPVVYSDSYYVDIGEHVFPTLKYRLLKKRIESELYLSDKIEFCNPETIKEEEVLLVHSNEFINKLRTGNLSSEEICTLEVPFSEALVEAAFMCCGGTVTAAGYALDKTAAVHLGGGFHHAFPDHGEGFCILNDVGVAIKTLQNRGQIEKAMVIDCDLHQGNGTAYIFKDDPSVFTFSIHQQNTYPLQKPESDLDVGLNDFTKDKVYLQHLFDNIPKIISTFNPEIIVYVAGADPYEGDQLGNIAISKKGLRERDNFICEQARNFEVPVVITLAGGYAVDREDTIDIHFATVEECVKVFTGR